MGRGEQARHREWEVSVSELTHVSMHMCPSIDGVCRVHICVVVGMWMRICDGSIGGHTKVQLALAEARESASDCVVLGSSEQS